MTDRPILFSAPMVRSLLAGTKTQTRRIIKPQPTVRENGTWLWEGRNGGFVGAAGTHVDEGFPQSAAFWARIQPGDRLWVREAWGGYRGAPTAEEFAGGVPVFYRADPEDAGAGIDVWRPSIHMPRWASRLTLYVTAVRVERLQDISEADARAEGAECDTDGWRDYQMPSTQCCADPVSSYRTLWDSINGPGSWEQNPWVASYTFIVRLGNIDTLPATLEDGA